MTNCPQRRSLGLLHSTRREQGTGKGDSISAAIRDRFLSGAKGGKGELESPSLLLTLFLTPDILLTSFASLLLHLSLRIFKHGMVAKAIANVDKVTLEFGIELGGEAGVPYVTKGTAKSNLKITVECSFPDKTETAKPPRVQTPG